VFLRNFGGRGGEGKKKNYVTSLQLFQDRSGQSKREAGLHYQHLQRGGGRGEKKKSEAVSKEYAHQQWEFEKGTPIPPKGGGGGKFFRDWKDLTTTPWLTGGEGERGKKKKKKPPPRVLHAESKKEGRKGDL